MLSYAGPVILVVLVALWFWGLALGIALITHPKLGTSVTATTGATPTDFATALYLSGDSMTTVGSTDLAPRTDFFRVLFVASSFIGLSVITLTLTYFLEIYNALHRRNTFALKIHLAGAETADAAELVAGVGPEGEFKAGYARLTEIGAELASFKESHHFYSVLLYFRFRDANYSLPRVELLTLDAATLMKSGLDDRRYAWLKESAAVTQIWRATMHVLTVLAATFLPGGMPQPEPGDAPDDETLQRWRRRYFAALRRFREAGIATVADEESGADTYVSLRARWDRYIVAFAAFLVEHMTVVDPPGTRPQDAEDREDFRARLRSVG